MQGTGWAVPIDGGAWARTIADVYMLWFTFLVSSNIVAASWWFARAPETVVRTIMMSPVCWAMIVTDLLTAAMTFVVAATVKPWAPPNFESADQRRRDCERDCGDCLRGRVVPGLVALAAPRTHGCRISNERELSVNG